jgi:DNA repair exonuclease SbcCD nuclease subunit
MTVFKKIATLTDVHFGRGGNSPIANNDNIEFIKWFIEEAKTWGADCIGVLGDWHDSRYSIQLGTLDSSLTGMELLSNAFEKVYFITGNHDLMYRDKRDVASTIFAKNVKNITFINEPLTLGQGTDSVTFLPWLVGDERKMLREIESRYIFAHAELNGGFYMNSKVIMPDHENGVSVDDFGKSEYLFTGHFHFRQHKRNVIYTGNIMPFDFADDWDDDRGAMFFQWGREPEFRAWPDQPSFRTMKLSELIENPTKFLKPKLTARVTMDVDLSFEHKQVIKEEFTNGYDLRRLELIEEKSTAHSDPNETLKDVVFQTVDQIVHESIDKLESDEFNSNTLREIYIDCQE